MKILKNIQWKKKSEKRRLKQSPKSDNRETDAQSQMDNHVMKRLTGGFS